VLKDLPPEFPKAVLSPLPDPTAIRKPPTADTLRQTNTIPFAL
jgi:hypothetical protein